MNSGARKAAATLTVASVKPAEQSSTLSRMRRFGASEDEAICRSGKEPVFEQPQAMCEPNLPKVGLKMPSVPGKMRRTASRDKRDSETWWMGRKLSW